MPVTPEEPDEAADQPADETPDEPADDPADEPARDRTGRMLTLLGWTVAAVAVLGLAWIVVTGVIARAQLEDARQELGDLRAAVLAGDVDKAGSLVADIRDHTGTARWLTTGPAWWVASNLPAVGSPLRTGRAVAAQADRLGDDVLPAVLELGRLVPARSAAPTSGIDLAAVDRAAPVLTRATDVTRSARDVVAGTDRSWLSFVGNGRDDVLRELTRLDGELTGAQRAARILPPMLGADGVRRYFVGFLNEAEARGGGGIPGAFAIVTADHGKVAFERFGTDVDLTDIRANVDLGADVAARYRNDDITGEFVNSNLSPDFSVAARIWAGMWQAKTGERVDGALALDPTALSYLLNVTGPARLPGGGTVTGDDVVGITQKRQYALFPGTSGRETAERKAYLVSIARAVSDRLTETGPEARLVRALSRAAGERRLVVWSAQPAVERELRAANWAGQLGLDSPGPYSGFVVNNAAGSKLDYYLQRAVSYRRSDCRRGGTATATVRLTNTAPAQGLPPYVTFRADAAPAGAEPGDNRLLVTYYADRSARITSLRVDGKTVPLFPQPENDTIAATTTVELPVGATVTVQVTVAEPAATGPVTVLRQPGVRPVRVDLRGDRCA